MSLDDISAKVVPVVSKITGDADVQTQKVAGTNEVIIKTKTLDVEMCIRDRTKIPLLNLAKATVPFLIAFLVCLALIVFVPGLSLWLPSILG